MKLRRVKFEVGLALPHGKTRDWVEDDECDLTLEDGVIYVDAGPGKDTLGVPLHNVTAFHFRRPSETPEEHGPAADPAIEAPPQPSGAGSRRARPPKKARQSPPAE